MIETEILKILINFTLSKQPGIINHIIWLFANLLDNEELCHIIINTVPNFITIINTLLKEYSNTYIFKDIFENLSWLVFRIFTHTGDRYIENFFVSFPIFSKVLENEVDSYSLNMEIGNNTDSDYDDNLLNSVLRLFEKFAKYIEDAETLKNLIYSNLLTAMMKLLSRNVQNSQIKISSGLLFLVFRIIGGLLTSDNDSDIDYILNNFNFVEVVERILTNNNSFNGFEESSDYSKRILKDIAWCMSNITGGSKSQVDRVLNSSIPVLLINYAKVFKESNFIKEVLYMFYNAFDYGSYEAKNKVLSEVVVNLICDAIINMNYKHEITKYALDFLKLILTEAKSMFEMNVYYRIKKILEINDIPNFLNKLQLDKNQGISEMAEFLLLDNWSVFEY